MILTRRRLEEGHISVMNRHERAHLIYPAQDFFKSVRKKTSFSH